MANTFKKVALRNAYLAGVRRCPCCNVQLVWKPHTKNLQKNLATVDHIIARGNGGPDISDNMFVMCRECNSDRGMECFLRYSESRAVPFDMYMSYYKKALCGIYSYTLYQFYSNANNNKERYKKLAKEAKLKFQKHFTEDLHELVMEDFVYSEAS